MLKYFINKDGSKVPVQDVLDKGLFSDRFPMPYLQMCAQEREWKGKCSVTQLLQGTRKAYLTITCDYAIDPEDQAFRILGTRSHAKLEKLTPKESFSELYLSEEDIHGTMDLLEQQPNGEWWLIDYKTSGSYAIGKALGIVKKRRPAFDKDGLPVVYNKSGKWGKAGDQKMEDYYDIDPATADLKDWALQLNKYRTVVEKYFDIKISRLKIFAIVRDGNTMVAKGRGIDQNTYYIDIPFMDDKDVNEYFDTKAEKLIKALAAYEADPKKDFQAHVPSKCTDAENWDGNMCKAYCNVADSCRMIGDNFYLSSPAITEDSETE